MGSYLVRGTCVEAGNILGNAHVHVAVYRIAGKPDQKYAGI